MSELLPARPDMFEEICALHFSPDTNEAEKARIRKFHRPIFHYQWERDDQPAGHVLASHGRIIGFLGAYFSRRIIDHRPERFCNLTSWMVAEGHRNESLRLLMPYLKLKECTLTGFSAAKKVYPIYQRFGFKALDTRVQILPLLPSAPGLTGAWTAIHDPGIIEPRLAPEDRRILRDHRPYDCRHLLLQHDAGYLYLVFTFTCKRGFRMAYLHYLSDAAWLRPCLGRIKWELLRQYRILFLCLEERWLRGRKPLFSKTYLLGVPRVYRTPHIEATQVDSLYSELVAANIFEKYFY